MDTQGSLTHIAVIFKFGDVSGPRAKKWPKVNRRLKIVNYFTCMRHLSCRWYGPPVVDLNGYPSICNPYCRNIQIRRCEWTQGKKWPKVNHWLKIVNYFTCMRHFSCRWYGPPEVDLNGYPRISNPYCRDIKIRRYEWTQGKKMTQSKSQIKGSKRSVGGYPPHIYHHIFWQYVGQYVGPIFSWEKINEYFWYHPEIFLGVFYDNLC